MRSNLAYFISIQFSFKVFIEKCFIMYILYFFKIIKLFYAFLGKTICIGLVILILYCYLTLFLLYIYVQWQAYDEREGLVHPRLVYFIEGLIK